MKKIFLSITSFTILLFCSPAFAEEISGFDARIQIRADASIVVRESIVYDFGTVSRHGIYRDIPVSYKARGGNYTIRLSDISVTDEHDAPYPFVISSEGMSERIKIGDANALISGIKTYRITYVVRRAINFLDDHDELYWNVTGNGWQVPVARSSAEISLPQAINFADMETACFAGPEGAARSCSGASVISYDMHLANAAEFMNTALQAGDGLTIVVGFPKNIVSKPSAAQVFFETVLDNGILVLPLIAFAGLFYLWHARGRDPKGRETIVVQYEPPDGLTPSEVGTIIDERAQNRDISAAIIQLAVRGYLKITRTEEKKFFGVSTDYIFEKLKNENDLENPFERKLFLGMFSHGVELSKGTSPLATVPLSKLKTVFYKELNDVKSEVYKAVTAKGYFIRNPKTVRSAYAVGGVVVMLAGFFIGRAWGGLGVFSFILSGMFLMLFGLIMPAKTKKGVLAKEYILGLKEYLSVAEKERIAFHNAPEKDPQRFEKLLPYAMVLGVEKAWAAQFADVYTQPPSWYAHGGYPGTFNSLLFVNALGNFSSQTQSTLATPPRSAAGGGSGLGGGGFSGGGFGGGGGGSW